MSTYPHLRRFWELESDYLQVERSHAQDKSKSMSAVYTLHHRVVKIKWPTLFNGKCSQLRLTVSLLISILSLRTLSGDDWIPADLKFIISKKYVNNINLSSTEQLGNDLLGLTYRIEQILIFCIDPQPSLTLCGKYPDISNNELVQVSAQQESLSPRAFHNS